MSVANHDKLVHRLSLMLLKLNQGEALDPRALADEFGVNLRTIQRDLNQRFTYLPLHKQDGRYFLEPSFLGRLTRKDVEAFAALAGVQGLFPALSDAFLRDVFDARLQESVLVRGHHYESLGGKETLFGSLQRAIADRRQVSFRQMRGDGSKRFDGIEPYRMLNHNGIWYLAAKDRHKLKTFAFSSIDGLLVGDTIFDRDPAVDRVLAGDGLWFGSQTLRVELAVSVDAARYFKRRPLMPNQEILAEHPDGSLLVATTVGHENEVLPQVRYWIPHVRIVSPEELALRLEQQLQDYLAHSASSETHIEAPGSLRQPAPSATDRVEGEPD